MSKHDGALQLEVVPNATEAVEIQRGVGHTAHEDGDSDDADDSQQSSLDEADGPGEVLNEELDDAIEQWTTARQDGDGADRDGVVAAVADDLGVTPTTSTTASRRCSRPAAVSMSLSKGS